MAINSNVVLGEKNRSLCSSKTSNLSSCRLIKINFAGKDGFSNTKAHGPNNNSNIKSPYFTNDKVPLLNRVTAKKVFNKKPTEFMSSLPLAASVYKANSDEFKLKKRGSNKVKKSVLTLPNEPAPMPKTYTVSDLNDSEYFNVANDNRANKPKKRRTVKRTKKTRLKEHAKEFSNRDTNYCSQLNIDLDCSSSEIVNFTGDGERISKLSYKSNNSVNAGSYPHDVWAVLRNINKFQFRPTPPASQKSVVPLRKRRPIIAGSNHSNDTHFIETCTEEFAYISSYEVDNKIQESCSPSSSFDRITVINKKSDEDKIMQQFSHNIFGSNLMIEQKIKSNVNNQSKGNIKPRLKDCSKKLLHPIKKTANYQGLANNTRNKNLQLEGGNVATEKNNNLFLPELKLNFKTSSIFNPSENCSDNSSIKENDAVFNDEKNIFQKSVRYGDDWKCINIKSLTKNPIAKGNVMKPISDTDKQLNGITKVILSKGKEIVPPKSLEVQRKPRLPLTLPNTNMPKLTRFEIKRRLANQKFPIIILGKDQITNQGMYVENVDPPQFNGLNKHIWPFMLEWYEEIRTGNINLTQKKEIMKSKVQKLKNNVSHHDATTNMNDVSNKNIVPNKREFKKKKNSTLQDTHNQKQLVNEVSADVVQKSKPFLHLKNKVFHFLNKNPRSLKFSENDWSDQRVETTLKDKQVDTSETIKNYNNLNNKSSRISIIKEITDKLVENKIVQKPMSPLRHQWAKGKWASDFIENIIKKIRSGVYYGVDRKEHKHRTSGTEVSTQTDINHSENTDSQNAEDFDIDSTLALAIDDDPLKKIPEFDKTLTTLEIETISTSKIAVKHCITNVVVHFDIQILGETKNVSHTRQIMSCIPLDVTDNQEKVFKCNTSIINSILPAELCSIIPTMMRNILNGENEIFLHPATLENIQSNATVVSELKALVRPSTITNFILPGWAVSDEVRCYLDGQFRNAYRNYKNMRTDVIHPKENMNSVLTLLSRINTQILCYYNKPPVILHMPLNSSNVLIENPPQRIITSNNCCMALQPYEPKKFSVVPFTGWFSITDFIKQIVDTCNKNQLNKKIKIISNGFKRSNIHFIISRPLLISQDLNQDMLSRPLEDNKVGVISLFNAFKRSDLYNSEEVHSLNTTDSNIKGEKQNALNALDDGKLVLRKKRLPIKVLRKKSYVKCYRKCNSTSTIPNYKSTPLNKVTNLEEFCQVLGPNLFCDVLDGCLEKRILEAIEEMKNWITDISPKQALLILLLTNKKDTPNLIRFRPVLLQGIAVNRITKADELDTEIEVIERENFKLSQYEGISYVPASPKNQDSLLEELYWIAKTTASDYQKTFDESSEKLLKSLLAKRKKLNPSYLRVMARYVGLGLLAPTKL